MRRVYLAGLISGDKPETMQWRLWARRRIKDLAYYRGFEVDVVVPGEMEKIKPGELTDPSFTAKDVLLRDYREVLRADVILVNLDEFGSQRPSIGTLFELAWAWEHKKIVIAVDGIGLMREHPFMVEAVAHHFENLDQACKFVVEKVL